MKALKDICIYEDTMPAGVEEGVLYLKKTSAGYTAGNYLIENLEMTDRHYLEKVYNRLCMEPIDIAVTDRIILRETSLKDAPELYRILQTPEVNSFVNDEPSDYSEFCEKLDAYKKSYDFYDCGYWSIFEKATDKLIGRCGISYNNIEGEVLPELGFLIDPLFAGRSLSYEAALASLDYVFDYLGEKTVYARADSKNSRSARLLKRLGFKPKKELKKDNETVILYSMNASL